VQEPAVGSMHLFLVAKSIKVIVYCKQSSMLPFMFYDLVQIGYADMYVIVQLGANGQEYACHMKIHVFGD